MVLATAQGRTEARRRRRLLSRSRWTSRNGCTRPERFPAASSSARVRRAALALAREVERRAPTIATSKWWKEERHGVFVDYNQNAKDRTVASAYWFGPGPGDRSPRRSAGRRCKVSAGRLHARDHARPVRRIGGRHRHRPASRITRAAAEAVGQTSREGLGDAPWPPHYQKQRGEPARVQPSKGARQSIR